MNTININSTVQMAMDGQNLYISNAKTAGTKSTQNVTPITPDGSQVAQNIKDNIAQTKADTQELQKMANNITGRKLQFNVNKELGSVVVTILDSNTNKVLKQIPSEDIQNLKLRIRKAIGNIFDELA
ncbi:MAG: flagellar protein FlaG [Treponema sp.]|nr:flagellar protein FlaG [Treponema sp.]MBO5482021.1 flagellar protein FlaG [Spirochaetaceae bacterium]